MLLSLLKTAPAWSNYIVFVANRKGMIDVISFDMLPVLHEEGYWESSGPEICLGELSMKQLVKDVPTLDMNLAYLMPSLAYLNTVKYRIYADGEIVHEDDFTEKDNEQPYCDDYATYTVPSAIVDFIQEQVL